ncbi:FtsH protease activity modulator HflK [Legionella sp. W05-934-2]|jgi:membrane protease subunit HflK|uniref:FtsH protease activity modulator HflK n=1 Tax=Legionella sp. W05-934-2 TaxID=1198649 RepID=UPI00346382BB
MGWNDSGNEKDPWGGKQEPPDLDEALKRFQQKLKKSFMGGKGRGGSNDETTPPGGGFIIGIVFAALFVIWLLSGIFIVQPAEQAAILRFGKYVNTVGSGPHWIPRIISTKIIRNVESVMDYSYSGQMLTSDENLVQVSLAVQYRIADLKNYLFEVTDPQESLRQATSSALRQVIGTTTLNEIITEGRETWGASVQTSLEAILNRYKVGIMVVSVSPQPARAPESVQDAFDDAIKAQEDEKRFIEQAKAYEAQVVPIAKGQAKRIFQEARAYVEQAVNKAEGDVAEFIALLSPYKNAPKVTSDRMYFDTMQQVLSQSSKIIVDGKSGNLMYLPLEKLVNQKGMSSQIMSLDDSQNKQLDEMQNSISSGRQQIRKTYSQGEDI